MFFIYRFLQFSSRNICLSAKHWLHCSQQFIAVNTASAACLARIYFYSLLSIWLVWKIFFEHFILSIDFYCLQKINFTTKIKKKNKIHLHLKLFVNKTKRISLPQSTGLKEHFMPGAYTLSAFKSYTNIEHESFFLFNTFSFLQTMCVMRILFIFKQISYFLV